MRSYLIRGVLALAVVVAASAPAAAQSIIRGQVVDAMNQPVPDATVIIDAVGVARRVQTTTDDEGNFTQIGLSTGDYTITVTKGDLKATVPARASQGAPFEVTITLAPAAAVGGVADEAEAAAVRELVSSGVAALEAERFDEAIAAFSEIVAKVPNCGDCYYNLGMAYTRKNDYAQAEAAFKQALEINPNHSDAYSGLANVYNATKRFDLAAEASARASELTATAGGGASAEALYNQGVIFWNAGNFSEAKTQFERAIAADPNIAMAHYQLGMANLNLGQIPDARAAFEQYLKVAPNGDKAAEVKVFLEQLPQ